MLNPIKKSPPPLPKGLNSQNPLFISNIAKNYLVFQRKLGEL